MSPTLIKLGIDKMSVEERRKLIAEIEETIPKEFQPPEWHLKLLEERIAHADAHPEDRIPWKQAIDDLRNNR